MPGVRMRFIPVARARLIAAAVSDGLATKNFLIGIERPGVGPSAQVVPAESCCGEGAKTSNCPEASAYRYGASRVTGLVASVVYGPPHAPAGKHWAGAPTTPENTWFQTPLVQPSRSLFLTSHCCWEPLMTTPPE